MSNETNKNPLYIPSPTQEVVETIDALYIDGFKIDFVLTDSVKTKPFSEDAVEVTLTFIAKSFTDESK
ncbi:hypothetical protein [Oceanobacillus sp. FSL W7-1293]|uniref:hypothetical protein n=1 Tax=Oceanobacillus sp. FSL W7-1293 TaxID=2921699 RepID=UPI0030CC0390